MGSCILDARPKSKKRLQVQDVSSGIRPFELNSCLAVRQIAPGCEWDVAAEPLGRCKAAEEEPAQGKG